MSVELKIKNLTAEEIAKVCRAELIKIGSPASEIVERISHDSREGGDKTLFCAIVGEKYDGHDFIADAVSAGSQVVLLSSLPENTDGLDFYCFFRLNVVKLKISARNAAATHIQKTSVLVPNGANIS